MINNNCTPFLINQYPWITTLSPKCLSPEQGLTVLCSDTGLHVPADRGRVASSPLPKSQGPRVQLQLEITLTLPGFVVA